MSFGTPMYPNNTPSPQNAPGSFASLGADLFQVPSPQPQQQPAPQYNGAMSSGGMGNVPPGFQGNPAPGGTQPGYNPYQQVPQVAPYQQTPTQQQANPYQQPPAYNPYTAPVPPANPYSQPAPQAPAPYQQPAAPGAGSPLAPQINPYLPAPQVRQIGSTSQLERLVSQGALTREDALMFKDDATLFDSLLEISRTPAPPTAPPAPMPGAAPAAPTTPYAAPAASVDYSATAHALTSAGLLEFKGGLYVAKAPEAHAIAEGLNAQQRERDQILTGLRDPESWLRKAGQNVYDPQLRAMEQHIRQLEERIQASVPKPHEQWIAQHRDALYVEQNGQRQFTPAGQVYNNTWAQMEQMGVKDERVMHLAASQAAQVAFTANQMPAGSPPTQQQTFMQAAAGYQQPLNPGFTMPGTPLSNQQRPQNTTPVNSRGMVDWDVLQAGLLNGSIPR